MSEPWTEERVRELIKSLRAYFTNFTNAPTIEMDAADALSSLLARALAAEKRLEAPLPETITSDLGYARGVATRLMHRSHAEESLCVDKLCDAIERQARALAEMQEKKA